MKNISFGAGSASIVGIAALLLCLTLPAGAFQATAAGSISGIVLDADGKPAAGVGIAYHTATELRAKAEATYNSPVPGSSFAEGIARMTAAQKKAAIDGLARIDPNPSRIYVGGTPAGTTDANGAFTINNLSADTYVVTAAKISIRQSGSRQPIAVNAGDQVKLPTPMTLKRDPGPGGQPENR